MPSPSDLLDPQTLAQAEALGLLARQIVEGPTSGENRSPFHGFSVEFSEHRQYVPGDDLRHLDWKIVGKTDRLYVKRYQQETNYHCQLLLDASNSMRYGEFDTNKMSFARKLTACLAYMVLKQRDHVSLRLFDQNITATIPKTGNMGSMNGILRTLVTAEASGQTRIPLILHEIAAASARRGIIILVSDLFDDEDAILSGIRHLRFAGHEVIVFHTLHSDELQFPFKNPVRFDGLEEALQITIRPGDVRKSYLEEFDLFRRKVREGCERSNCHYVAIDTSKPMHESIGTYLAFRHDMTV